ncbi:MAG: ABC transporter ATP-binding protein [Halioglobus sp.]|nr:ABC transporter ATP-binding protein [Halioglobus sp.]
MNGHAAHQRMLIDVEGVAFSYPHASAPSLVGVTLQVPKGSCFGLLGPNGAGKTTLISLLTGLLSLQRGRIAVDGMRFPGDADAIKRMSALVPQDYAFYPALTGRENLRFFAGLYEIPAAQLPARLDQCIDICSLGPVLDKPAATYSGGIKRRLNLALGLLCSPRLLYLDEPTVGIDAQSRYFILEAIKGLKNEGMTIIYTSHYMEEVEQICDDVAIIDDGRLVLQEPIDELLLGGRDVYVTPQREPGAGLLAQLGEQLDVVWDGARLILTPPPGLPVSSVLAQLERHGVGIARLQMGGYRLEEVYLSLTRTELRS